MRKTFKYTYTAFGSVLSDSGTFDNDYLYTSQAIDENDLNYMHGRYYDKSMSYGDRSKLLGDFFKPRHICQENMT